MVNADRGLPYGHTKAIGISQPGRDTRNPIRMALKRSEAASGPANIHQ